MLVEACYRLTYHGEVIHAKYDTSAMKIIGMPEDFYDVKDFGLTGYDFSHYQGTQRDFDAYVEFILLSQDENAIVIEFVNQGAFVFTFDGKYTCVRTGLEFGLSTHEWSFCARPDIRNYRTIGFRVTKMLQLRAADKVYQLTYDIKNNVIHTNDGVLIPEFDVNSLDKIDPKYSGYKDCIAQGHYAVVYRGGSPVFLDKTPDNKLIVI